MKRKPQEVKPLMQLKPFFRAAVRDDGALEIMVYDRILTQSQITLMEWYGIPTDGYVSAMGVKNKLAQAGSSYSKIVLRINSPGGNAFEGIAIGNLLKATGKPIEVYVDAIAASAASIVAMCGTTITMANNAMMMFHNAWTECEGYASDMRKMADTLDTISESIGQTYSDKTGKPIAEVKALMDAETWMGAEDCVKNGFATSVSKEENAPAMAMAQTFSVMNGLKLPDCMKPSAAAPKAEQSDTKVCECSCQSCADGTCAECSNKDCIDENCPDCPNQEEEVGASSNVSLFVARQWELEHGIRA